MLKSEYLPVAAAAVAAFIFSSLYYSPLVLGNVWRTVDPVAAAAVKPSSPMAFVELFGLSSSPSCSPICSVCWAVRGGRVPWASRCGCGCGLALS